MKQRVVRGGEERRGEERRGEERRGEEDSQIYLKGDVTSSLCEGMSQQKHVIHTDPQRQEREHLR